MIGYDRIGQDRMTSLLYLTVTKIPTQRTQMRSERSQIMNTR